MTAFSATSERGERSNGCELEEKHDNCFNQAPNPCVDLTIYNNPSDLSNSFQAIEEEKIDGDANPNLQEGQNDGQRLESDPSPGTLAHIDQQIKEFEKNYEALGMQISHI